MNLTIELLKLEKMISEYAFEYNLTFEEVIQEIKERWRIQEKYEKEYGKKMPIIGPLPILREKNE